jgi:hypothetical protein
VSLLADQQKGPTCGFEAIENIIQLFYDIGNDLLESDLLQRAESYGAAVPMPEGGVALDIRAYESILQDYRISSNWYPFDPAQVVIPALANNRGVLAVGDVHCLYPDPNLRVGSNHAFVLTNFYTDQSEQYVVGYVGLDSNFAQTEVFWPHHNMARALQWASQNVVSLPVLITDAQFPGPNKARYYKVTNTGLAAPVY